jgi:hypothetical protein
MKAASIAARLGSTLKAKEHEAVPKGWYTVRDIQLILGMRWAANASTRAKNLHERGIVERMEWRAYKDYGFARAYIYRLKPPHKTWQQAVEAYHTVGEEKVPKGWARPVDFARILGISAEAIRNAMHRHNLETKMIRTNRGVSGLHLNLYIRTSDIMRVYRKRL